MNTLNYGATVGLIMPLGHRLQPKCEKLAAMQVALAEEAVTQRQLDTCLTVAKAGFHFAADSNLGQRCALLIPNEIPQPPAPSPTFTPHVAPAVDTRPSFDAHVVIEMPRPAASHSGCIDDPARDRDLADLHALRRELRTHHPGPRIVALHKRLAAACNVTSSEIITALDG